MNRIGTSIREQSIPFKDEINFIKENGYDLAQIWYKKGTINTLYEKESIEAIKNAKVNIIIHALMDIHDFDIYGENLTNILINLNHKELIIHPVLKDEEINQKNIEKLENNLIKYCKKLEKLNITVYIENNHDHMKVFYTLEQWKRFFSKAPKNVELLIDIVHILFCDDYNYLKKLIDIKYPKALHIADTIKGMVNKKHLHIPIGTGIIDFNIIFNDILKDFDGIIILEINNTDKNMIDSKNKLIEMLKKESN